MQNRRRFCSKAGRAALWSCYSHPFWLMLVFALSAWVPTSKADSVKVYPDRNNVVINESFRLTFEIDEKAESNPDFSPLEADFEILGRSQRSNISIINGSVKRSTIWILNLMAKRAGNLQIPSISFGSLHSEAQTLAVQPSGTSSNSQSQSHTNLRLELDVSSRDPYVQQQILITVKLVRDTDMEINEASLSEPKLSGGSAIVQQLGKDRISRTDKGDEHLLTVERTYAVFPQQSGEVDLEPIKFQGQIVQGAASLFDPFAQSIVTKRLQTESVKLRVRPIPAAFQGKQWLPAKDLQLREIWSRDPPEFKLDQPLTRTLTLVANGLTAGQLPELGKLVVKGIKCYPDQPVLEDQKKSSGVAGIREEKVVLIPAQPGHYMLPAVRIPWWNIITDKLEVAELPERAVDVESLPGDQMPSVTLTPTEVPGQIESLSPPVAAPADAERQSPTRPDTVVIGLGLGWVLTLLAWGATALAWHRDRKRSRQSLGTTMSADRFAQKSNGKGKKLVDAVLRAAHLNDAQATRLALIDWARAEWPEQALMNLEWLAKKTDNALASYIIEVNRVLYGDCSGRDKWQSGEALAAAFKAWLKERARESRATPAHIGELEPLFKS